MSRRWIAFAVTVLVLGALNGCNSCGERPRLFSRFRAQSATPCCPEGASSGAVQSYPMMMPGGGSCCNGNGNGNGGVPMFIPGPGMGTMPGGVTEQLPGAYPGFPPANIPPPNVPTAPGEAKPMPAGPSGDLMKNARAGRVTNMPEVK